MDLLVSVLKGGAGEKQNMRKGGRWEEEGMGCKNLMFILFRFTKSVAT
jgi:hypothetical protein